MELELTAHNILAYISTSKWVKTSDGIKSVYAPMGYTRYSLKQIIEVLPQYELRELKFASDMLAENEHIKKYDADDWWDIDISCNENGEKAFERNLYIQKHDENKIKISENWKKKYWWVLTIIGFLFGSVIAPISTEWLKRVIWPDTTQQRTPTHVSTDTSHHL